MRYPRTLIQALKRHEGFRGEPYVDSVGKTTIGYGRNLEDNPLSTKEAEYLLVADLSREEVRLERIEPRFADVPYGPRREALLNMAFNLGAYGLRRFRRMWAAIERGDWDQAAEEALDSRWSRQVGYRSRELAEQLKTGKYPN